MPTCCDDDLVFPSALDALHVPRLGDAAKFEKFRCSAPFGAIRNSHRGLLAISNQDARIATRHRPEKRVQPQNLWVPPVRGDRRLQGSWVLGAVGAAPHRELLAIRPRAGCRSGPGGASAAGAGSYGRGEGRDDGGCVRRVECRPTRTPRPSPPSCPTARTSRCKPRRTGEVLGFGGKTRGERASVAAHAWKDGSRASPLLRVATRAQMTRGRIRRASSPWRAPTTEGTCPLQAATAPADGRARHPLGGRRFSGVPPRHRMAIRTSTSRSSPRSRGLER